MVAEQFAPSRLLIPIAGHVKRSNYDHLQPIQAISGLVEKVERELHDIGTSTVIPSYIFPFFRQHLNDGRRPQHYVLALWIRSDIALGRSRPGEGSHYLHTSSWSMNSKDPANSETEKDHNETRVEGMTSNSEHLGSDKGLMEVTRDNQSNRDIRWTQFFMFVLLQIVPLGVGMFWLILYSRKRVEEQLQYRKILLLKKREEIHEVALNKAYTALIQEFNTVRTIEFIILHFSCYSICSELIIISLNRLIHIVVHVEFLLSIQSILHVRMLMMD